MNACFQAVKKMISLLDELDGWVDDIPPQPTPQRFGNLAFRDYGKRLHEVFGVLLLHDFPLTTIIYPEIDQASSKASS